MANVWVRGIGRRSIAILGATLLIASLTPIASVAARTSGFAAGGSIRTAQRHATVSGREAAKLGLGSAQNRHVLTPRPRPTGFAVKGGLTPLTTPPRSPKIAFNPTLVSTRTITGLSQDDTGYVPPDPWVAASGSYVVQSTNGGVRVYNRAGGELATISTAAMFSIPTGYADSDPRILWDAYHGRWVGVEVGFDDAVFSDTFLSIIVSDGADPLGSWNVYQFGYGNSLPDYPGIVSSTDKLVLTVNEFTDGVTFAGTSFLLLPWSSILAGTPVSAGYGGSADDFGLRAARLMSNTPDLHMVYENSLSGTLSYFRISGPALSPSISPESDLGISNGAILSHDPRQPGDADGIVDAVDGRVPDMVWKSGNLWFARTIDFPWDTINNDLAIDVYQVQTGTFPASVVTHAVRGGPAGTDAFTPGVGLSTSGTFFLTYSESSASAAPSIIAEAETASYGFSDPIVVATSPAIYSGTRWGDYAGIALDPAGTDAVWQAHEVAAANGHWQSVVSRLILDWTSPTATAPVQSLVTGSTLGSTVPVKVAWTGSDSGSGVVRYRLDEGAFGDAPTPVAVTAGASSVRAHVWVPYGYPYDSRYVYQVVSQDDAGNVSLSPAVGPSLTTTVYQQTLSSFTYSSGWGSSSSTAYSGGSAKYSSTVGKYVSFRASGRSFGFLTYRASTRGRARIYVDGVLKTTLTLTSSTVKARNLAYTITFASSGTHTIKVVVYSGRVDVDGFVVLR